MRDQVAVKKTTGQSTERRAKLLIALLCVVLSVVAVLPFFYMGRPEEGEEELSPSGLALRMPTTHDMFLHYDQMKSFHRGLSAGDLYPHWEIETNRGFGAPTMIYYPPASYYLTSLFYWLTGNWIHALLDTYLLMMIASAAAIYIYARRAMTRGPAILATTAYIFLPYHLIDLYQRAAIAELLGFVWMPLMLLFGERLLNVPSLDNAGPATKAAGWRGHLADVAGLAVVYGLFLWSHPPTAYQFSLGFGLFVMILGIQRKEWKGMARVGVGIAGGIALSAAYTLPTAAEQKLIRHEYMWESWPYHKTYVFVHDLYNREVHREFFARIDGIWALGAVIILVTGLAVLFQMKSVSTTRTGKTRIVLWTLLGLLATFMMTRYSEPVGRLIPRIETGVFTWRMLSITTFIIALLAGACLEAARTAVNRAANERRALGALGILVTAGGIIFSVVYVGWPMARAPFFRPEFEHLNYAMIPRTAPADPEELPENVPEAELEGQHGSFQIELWDPEFRVINVDLSEDDRLYIRTFYFPGWAALVDGGEAQISINEELGNIEIPIPKGRHRVVLEFRNTPVRTAGLMTTFITAALIAIAFGVSRTNERSSPRS